MGIRWFTGIQTQSGAFTVFWMQCGDRSSVQICSMGHGYAAWHAHGIYLFAYFEVIWVAKGMIWDASMGVQSPKSKNLPKSYLLLTYHLGYFDHIFGILTMTTL